MTISVFGLGYVGCVSATAFAQQGFEIIGVDINPEKVRMLNDGVCPILEPGLSELIVEASQMGRLRATSDYVEAIKASCISLICVGTPSDKSGSTDLSYVYGVANQIGETLKTKKDFHVVVLRSTALPGTLKRIIKIISDASGRSVGEGFGACSNPEFLREGSALQDFYDPPYTIIGESDQRSGDLLAGLYRNIDAPVFRMETESAEMIKYANNSFHALKVAFANEIAAICKSVGVSGADVMKVFCEDRRLNLSPAYLRPGFAFGGSCLPKDLRAITHLAKHRDLSTPMLSSVLASNEAHLDRATDMVLSLGKKKIGVLGISFKEDTDDLRESPMLTVVERLLGKGYDLRIYDRNVQLSNLLGSNRRYVHEHIPHITKLMVDKPSELLEHSEVVVLGLKSPEFSEIVTKANENQILVDFGGAYATQAGKLQAEYLGLSR